MRIANDVIGNAATSARCGDGFGSKRLRQTQRIGNAVSIFIPKLKAPPAFDVEGGPRPMKSVCQSLGIADEAGGARVFANADENPLACCPRSGNGVTLHLREHLLVNPF